jgi:hypothetical protein
MSSIAQEVRARVDKWNWIKVENSWEKEKKE